MTTYEYAVRYTTHAGAVGTTKPRACTLPMTLGLARAFKWYASVEQVRRPVGGEEWEPCDPEEAPPWPPGFRERLAAQAAAARSKPPVRLSRP